MNEELRQKAEAAFSGVAAHAMFCKYAHPAKVLELLDTIDAQAAENKALTSSILNYKAEMAAKLAKAEARITALRTGLTDLQGYLRHEFNGLHLGRIAQVLAADDKEAES